MVTVAMKLKDACSFEESYDQSIQHIKKHKHHFADKGLYSQNYGFSSGHVRIYEYWTKEKAECQIIDAFEL